MYIYKERDQQINFVCFYFDVTVYEIDENTLF